MTTSLRPVLLLWLASALLFLVHPLLGGVGLVASVLRYPDGCREVSRRVQTSDSLGRYGLATGLFVFVAYWLMQLPAPTDDLLRHISSYAYGYSHLAIYPHSSAPNFSQYPAFEHLVGAMAQAWGPVLTLQLVMATAWACAFLLAWGLANSSGASLSAGTVVLLCILFSTSLPERLYLGRPEVFGVLWAVSVTLCRNRASLLAWMVGGVLLSSSYWLFPLYLVFLLLLPMSWRARITAGVVLLAYHLIFWSWYLGSLSAYVQMASMIPVWSKNRIMPVLETGSIWQMFAHLPMLALTLLGLTGLGQLNRKKRIELCAVGVAVLLTGMVRYASAFALLMFVAALPLIPLFDAFIRKHLGAAVLVLMLPLMTAGSAQLATTPLAQLPRFKLPQGSKVLTGFNEATFALPFFNPGTVQVIPAMELGASEHAYQVATKVLSEGNLTCADIAQLDVTHVVEHSQRTMPKCLSLTAVQGNWRLWEITHGR